MSTSAVILELEEQHNFLRTRCTRLASTVEDLQQQGREKDATILKLTEQLAAAQKPPEPKTPRRRA